MAEKQRWVITTSGQRSVHDVANDVRQKGFVTDDILEAIGCITGTADSVTANAIRHVPGVVDVSAEPQINIGPPDSTTNW